MLKRLISRFKFKSKKTPSYKIVGEAPNKGVFLIQCLSNMIIENVSLEKSINNKALIGGLASYQACYLGMIAGENLRKKELPVSILGLPSVSAHSDAPLIFDRHGNIIFSHPKTKKRCSYQLSYIVSEKSLISLFSSEIAFYIGIQASINIGFGKRVPEISKLKLVVNN